MVEDDSGDARLTIEALKRSKTQTQLTVVVDGIEALAFLRCEGKYSAAIRPDIILLDLNMPRMNGRELLALIKQDPELQSIPVVVLTTSAAEEDIARSYFCARELFHHQAGRTEAIHERRAVDRRILVHRRQTSV